MASSDQNIEQFLDKVDEIEAIVKGLGSNNDTAVTNAMSKADSLISKIKLAKQYDDADDDDGLPKTKTGFSKTCINKVKDKDTDIPGKDDVNYDGMDQASFMQALEADAQERSKRRQEREKVATELKEKGNEEFRQGSYEKALEFYTQALREVKDNTALYTNRAQTYIKLAKYPEALLDCEWALRVFPNCVKAHIHKGRAHLGLKEYKEARECYDAALKCDPKKESLVKEYLAEVDRTELCHQQEQDAEKVFSEGRVEDVGMVDVLKRVQRAEQLPVYYSGGFRVMKSLLANTSDRTLFRTNGGIEMVTNQNTLHRCLSASPKSVSQEELDMLAAAFLMYTEACRDNEKNTEMLLQATDFPKYCTRYMEVKMKGQGKVLKSAIVNCLYTMSQLNIGQRLIVTHFETPRLLAACFTLIRTNKQAATAAASLLNNIALQKKFKSQLRDKIDETVSPAFELLLAESSCQASLPVCISMMTNLLSDKAIRTRLSARKHLWEACSELIAQHQGKLDVPLSVEILSNILGLLLNLTTDPSQFLREFGPSICQRCLALIQENSCAHAIVLRGLGLMSHILPHCIPAVDIVVDKGGTAVLLQHVRADDGETLKPAVKAITALTQINEEARKYIVDNKGLGVLVRHLQSDDEMVVGNAALCLSHCTQVPKVCTSLARTDIIKDLLVLARDGKRPAVQQNCAILIAKLAQGDAKHLERLRELHGIEILHSCMKYLK